MKRTSSKLFIYTLTSLAVSLSSFAYAQTSVTAPTLEGGVTASIGTFYVSPSSDGQDYAVAPLTGTTFGTINQEIVEVNPGYDFGFEAALGYIFEDTANGVELLYRTVHTSDDDSQSNNSDGFYVPVLGQSFQNVTSALEYDLNAVDLMFSQFMDIGTHVQMRFSLGASYVNLEKDQTSTYFGSSSFGTTYHSESTFNGFGPRLGTDARYDFGQGFGILAGASVAYFLGDNDTNDTFSSVNNPSVIKIEDDIDNHGVTNLRGNVGIDYVYFFDNDELSTVGVELGYLIDYYADAVQQLGYKPHSNAHKTMADRAQFDGTSDSNSLTFSGPYLNIKAAF